MKKKIFQCDFRSDLITFHDQYNYKKDYNKEKDKQECSCGGKLKRVIEWSGIAEGSGAGWAGCSRGNVI